MQLIEYGNNTLIDFYLKNGFTYSEEDLIGKECKSCPEYNTTCYPKVMVCKERVKDNYEY